MLEGDLGAITAEFAVALPAVLTVLTVSCVALAVQTQQMRLQSQASVVVDALASGESAQAAVLWLRQKSTGVTLKQLNRDGVLCVNLKQGLRAGVTLPSFAIEAESCAWVGRDVSYD